VSDLASGAVVILILCGQVEKPCTWLLISLASSSLIAAACVKGLLHLYRLEKASSTTAPQSPTSTGDTP
jgi:hypothetical protein